MRRRVALIGALIAMAGLFAGTSTVSIGSAATTPAVATVAGHPISLQAYRHWMYIAAKRTATEQKGSPVIVPSDPPEFTSCIQQARTQLPNLRAAKATKIRKDCADLFTALNRETMAFLIESYWYQADAAKLGIKLTSAQLNAAYAKATKAQFKKRKTYLAFLSRSGQTDTDIRYRVRVNILYSKLLREYGESTTKASQRTAETKVQELSTTTWGEQTRCKPLYATKGYCRASKTLTSTSTPAPGVDLAPGDGPTTPQPNERLTTLGDRGQRRGGVAGQTAVGQERVRFTEGDLAAQLEHPAAYLDR